MLNRRVRVYWPLDKSWYEGCVKSFDKISGKHLVQYDDDEEELLDLSQEKIEWVGEEEGSRMFCRLRRVSTIEEEVGDGKASGTSVEVTGKFRRLWRASVVEDDVDEESEGGDNSDDEDWGKNAEVEVDDDALVEMDLVDDGDGGEGQKLKGSAKRRVSGGHKIGSSKKCKSNVDDEKCLVKNMKSNVNADKCANRNAVNGSGGKSIQLKDNGEGPCAVKDTLMEDAAERFAAREAQKMPFLGIGRRDGNRRRPGDENYDPRTLYIPPDFLKSLTGGQRQWWEFKSKHMDKVLFFKMGKFYEIFEMDAHVGVKELDLQYMKGEQPHCGFPEKNFSMNVEKLARKGYRVLVVEQTETPEQLDIRRKEQGSKDKVVRREICAVVTKGTLTEGEYMSANPEASYLMSVTETCSSTDEHIFGACLVDVAASKIILGQFRDDPECNALCCLLSETRPVEIVKPAKLLSTEAERVIQRHTRSPLINELVPLSEFWDAEKTISELTAFYSHMNEHETNLPIVLSELVNAGADGSNALSALGGSLFYLKQAFLDESLLRFAKFELLPCSGFSELSQKPYMVLDAAALENLEIFENSRNGDSSGTLYAQLNHCMTPFGKRLLKTWLARPLYHLELIKERQDAVAGLKANLPNVIEFRKDMSKLPDMERMLAHIFASSEGNGRNGQNVVLYEDASKKLLQEFIAALRGFELMTQACSSLGVILETVESRLLHRLLTADLPDVHATLKHFKEAFDWVEANNSGRVIPHKGVDVDYDSACTTVTEVETSLREHLREQKKLLRESSINYVSVGKDCYLLEVPECLSGKVPKDYELKSSKKGFFRYWTPTIKKLLAKISQAESEKESKLKSILQRLIGRFCEHHTEWRQLVSTVAELDVLISIAIASDYYEGPTCRPIISELSSTNDAACLRAKSLGHPVLRNDSLGRSTFVPNDVSIGGSDHGSFILLTGPNMGGKSTLIRQVCLAVVLAQVGADVPAKSFEMSPVDRIFVRMGAKDHIMAGQSTFLTELLETSSMLSSATRNSLVALDELGRGTSTSDGQAIAESVLEHFVNNVQCRGMFSTHYHRLAVDYEDNHKVSLCHMACKVGEGVNGLEEVTFLYRLTPGACPKSYGVNVARLSGIPDTVLQRAALKSQEFEGLYGQNRKCTKDISSHFQKDSDLALARLLSKVTSNLHNAAESTLESLIQLQLESRMFLK